MRQNYEKLKAALTGLSFAARQDRSFRFQLLLVLPSVLVIGYLLRPLSELEILLLGFAYTLIIVTELQNSALEEALDHLHPSLHHRIGRSKDLAAGAVLASGIFLVFVVTVMLAERFL